MRDRIGIAFADRRFIALRIPRQQTRTTRSAETPEEPPPETLPSSSRAEKTKERISSILIVELAFTSDHGLLTDNTTDWKRGGRKYKDLGKQWTPHHSHPISQTKGTKLHIKARFDVAPASAHSAEVALTSAGTESYAGFKASAHFGGGPVTPKMAAEIALPDRTTNESISINWKARAEGRDFGAGSTSHAIYVTYGTPVDAGWPEDGVTMKRMAKAVTLVRGTLGIHPHDIVWGLMRLVPSYTLTPNPSVPSKYGHPNYFNDEGGAWAIADHLDARAECQAIVRFVRGILNQVGCPGEAKPIVVWADPDVSGGATALEKEWPSGGLAERTKVVGGRLWFARLLDSDPIAEGHVFSPTEVGFNNFEACLRFTHEGVTKYYGGGAGVYEAAQDVLRAFNSLCWVSAATLPNGAPGVRIEKIVKRLH